MAKFFTNTCPGVAVVTNPFMFVAVGNEFDTHVRVACGKQSPPQYEEVEPEGMKFKQLRILRGSYARRTPKLKDDRPQKDHVILVSERDNDKGNAVALIALPSGYEGDSVICVHDRAQVIADCFTGHGVQGRLGGTHHVLALHS